MRQISDKTTRSIGGRWGQPPGSLSCCRPLTRGYSGSLVPPAHASLPLRNRRSANWPGVVQATQTTLAMEIKPTVTAAPELAWLSDVSEAGPQLTQASPIGVRHFEIHAGPAMTHPECHPYCELGIHFHGTGVEFVEREKAERRPGDLFIAGPGIPHWFKVERYPLVGIAVYFLPSVLCELGPHSDGFHMLRRFTARQNLCERLVRPSPTVRKSLMTGFQQIRKEFERRPLGHEFRLRSLLTEMLVQLMRWERRSGREPAGLATSAKWQEVNLALHYLREHFAEPVYAHDVAKAVGVSESRLKVLFREALGMPWSRYVQGYRIQQAVALLSTDDCNVTQAALAVGFESLSHFNATFRMFMGMSPSAYLKRQAKMATK
jgi:AraC-like DNA-binding protein/quercetin dioxygenase-like cupin family protein